MRKIDRADGLHLVAHAHTVAAEDAFAHVFRNAERGIVLLRLRRGVRKAHAFDIKAHCKVLELTFAVVAACGAIPAVIGKQEF